jgi:pSer/pThr/pTyr-binding forkhead associated (FHA) protein
MAKLILSLDGQRLKEYDISKERTTIGRKPHNDIQIDNLAVSGEHAMIMTILNDSFLEDLGSTNGTMVNGQPVKKHFLQNDDVVEIGKYKLKYLNDKAGQMSQQEFEKTMVLRAPVAAQANGTKVPAAKNTQTTTNGAGKPGGTQTTTAAGVNHQSHAQTTNVGAAKPGQAQAAAAGVSKASETQTTNPQAAALAKAVTKSAADTAEAPSAGKPQPDMTIPPVSSGSDAAGTIQILSGPNAGRELPLSKPLTTLGKPGIQVAVIARRPQGYFITHVEGANFPVVNGKPLDAQAQKLQDHDIIDLAGVKMEFFLKT